MDIRGSRAVERAFALERIGVGPGLVLDLGPGPKARISETLLVLGFDVVAVDLEPVRDGFPRIHGRRTFGRTFGGRRFGKPGEDWIMTYTLKGDRKFEWGFVKTHLPEGEGFLLDIGPAPANPKPARIAAGRGWDVTAVGLQTPSPERSPCQQFRFILGDFNEVEAGGPYDWILNVSTIEHFGLAGRYGIAVQDDDADLRGMQKALGLLKPTGKMLLTVPVGEDTVFVPKHRVYGVERLPRLLAGYEVLEEVYYAKFGGSDAYQCCTKQQALEAEPTIEPSYYALGCFVVARAK